MVGGVAEADPVSNEGQLSIENNIGSSHPLISITHYDNSAISDGYDIWDASWLNPMSGEPSLYSDIGTHQLSSDYRLPTSTSDFLVKLVYNGTLSSDTPNQLQFSFPNYPSYLFENKPILFQSSLLPYGQVVDVRKAIAQNSGVVSLINLPAGSYNVNTPYGEGILTIGTRLLADLSDNGDINLEDFALLALDWQNPAQGQYVGDITGEFGIPDGYVDMYDLVEFCSEWLE